MGEVLRAFLDKNCIDSRPMLYATRLDQTSAGAGDVWARRQLPSIKCKMDCGFLVMGAAMDSAIARPGVGSLWQPKANASTFRITRGSNGEAFSNAPQPQTLQNYNLNNWVTWDEYPLFKPGELIMFDGDVRTSNTAAGAALYDFVTLMGVEYRMPDWWRWS